MKDWPWYGKVLLVIAGVMFLGIIFSGDTEERRYDWDEEGWVTNDLTREGYVVTDTGRFGDTVYVEMRTPFYGDIDWGGFDNKFQQLHSGLGTLRVAYHIESRSNVEALNDEELEQFGVNREDINHLSRYDIEDLAEDYLTNLQVTLISGSERCTYQISKKDWYASIEAANKYGSFSEEADAAWQEKANKLRASESCEDTLDYLRRTREEE